MQYFFTNIMFNILLLFSILCFNCQNQTKSADNFAKVGDVIISRESYMAFDKMKRQYPSEGQNEDIFPGKRTYPTACIETEILFNEAKSLRDQVKKSGDLKWKEKYFPAQDFLENVLDMNLGFLQEEIEAYYKNHKEDFKKVLKIKVGEDTTAANDSTADTSNVTYKDSVVYSSVDEVKSEIAQTLFLEKYPPDSAFFISMSDTSDSIVDTSMIENEWVNNIRQNISEFYMKQYYKEAYNKEYPDSVDEIFGEGKIITPEDFEIILSWIPEMNRESYREEQERKKYLIEWLLKWELFSNAAEKSGYSKTDEMKAVLDWVWKFEVAVKYMNEELLVNIKKDLTVDTAMCIYQHWDKTYKPGVYPDSNDLKDLVETTIKTKLQAAFDEKIHTLRAKTGITFLQSDDIDDKDKNPDTIAALADSLYGSGNSSDAEVQYTKLISDFQFTKQGEDALVEMAKILTEKEQYWEAIKNYRKFLLLSDDVERRCNIFFMIGFVYGEYLDKPELAESSYKWILKNSPDCELSDDAEFMTLHLDEPMIGVEELRAEAVRQGRKIEDEPANETKEESGDKNKS